MGKGNRETQTLPVLHLRETATKMGLLRKLRGILQLTAAGRKLRTDPVSLWWHLAGRMPPRSDRCETQAGLIWLLTVAAQRPGDPAEIAARTLAGIGWTLADGTPLSAPGRRPGRRGTPATCCGASAVSRTIPGATGRGHRTQDGASFRPRRREQPGRIAGTPR